MEEKNEINLHLVIPLPKYQQIMAYTNLVDTEITEFADITLDMITGKLTIGDVYLIKQEATGAHVEMEEEDVSRFMVELIKKGKTQLPRCWIHSHVNMSAFFSGTDVDTYTKTLNNNEWTVALVVNKRQEMKAVFQQYKPFLHTWDIPIEVDYADVPIPAKWKNEVTRKVKEKKWEQAKGWEKKGGVLVQTEGTPIQTTNTLPDYDIGQFYRKGTMARLPKDRAEAITRIIELDLVRTWDDRTMSFKFTNPYTNVEWIDFWGCVQDYNPLQYD